MYCDYVFENNRPSIARWDIIIYIYSSIFKHSPNNVSTVIGENISYLNV